MPGRLFSLSTSAAMTSAPASARAFALSEFGSRVRARTAKPLCLSFSMARASPPPCAPVAPTTAMIFLSAFSPSGFFAAVFLAAFFLSAIRSPPEGRIWQPK